MATWQNQVSNLTMRSRSVDKIKTLLRENDCPEDVIMNALAKTKKRTPTNKRDSTVTLRIPFCSDSLDKVVRSIIRKSRLSIQIAYYYCHNMRNRMVRSALLPPTLRSVWEIPKRTKGVEEAAWKTVRQLHCVPGGGERKPVRPARRGIFAEVLTLLWRVCLGNAGGSTS